MSEKKKKEEKDYRTMIRTRAELTQSLRQKKLEKMDRKENREMSGLRQKFAGAKKKEE